MSQPATAPVRVLIADDHFVAVFGIRKLLAACADFEVVGEAKSGADAVGLFRTTRPDVVLMDLKMPGFDGISAAANILREFPDARVLIVSSYRTEMDVQRARKVGAVGYVFKESGPQEFLRALRTVAAGAPHFPPEQEVGPRVVGEGETPLGTRDMQILRLLCQGLTNREIADRLGLSAGTVKVYAAQMRTKMGVASRSEAVFEAIRRGLVTTPVREPGRGRREEPPKG